MLFALLVMAVVAVVLAGPLLVRTVARRTRETLAARRRAVAAPVEQHSDPGRERRAESRARELLRSCVNDEEWAMYRDLGFIRVLGNPAREAGVETDGEAPYAYLIYAHRPIVAYEPSTAHLLSEYCVEFPDITGGGRAKLPASDDVLAKWMALTSDEARVIGRANMHLVGRQHDPDRVQRDLWRLSEWERRRGTPHTEAGAA